MKDVPSSIKNILTAIAVVMIVAVVVGCCMFFSEKPPTPTDPPTTDTTAPSDPTDPPKQDSTQIDFNIRGFLFNNDHQYLDSASFTAKGPALSELIGGDAAAFDRVEVDGFPDIVAADGCKGRIKEHKNGVLDIIVEKITQRRDYETGELNSMYTEVRYCIFIDSATSEFLMCIVNIEDYDVQFYFTPSEHPRSISDVLIRAYQD